MGETKVATTQDLQPGAALCVEVDGKKIALFNVDGNYYALDDACTHVGVPSRSVSGHFAVEPFSSYPINPCLL